MIYRDLRESDIPQLVKWLKDFNGGIEFPGKAPINDESAHDFFSRFIGHEANAAVIAEKNGKPVGAIGFAVMRHPWTGKQILFKAFWYSASPGVGVRLLRHVCDLCRNAGYHYVVAGSMIENSHRILERMGFKPCETNYILEL